MGEPTDYSDWPTEALEASVKAQSEDRAGIREPDQPSPQAHELHRRRMEEVMSERPFIKSCPMCGGQAKLTQDNSIFAGQDYGDRYPPKVARQNHGFQIRCHCGLQTCWWHYDHEALEHWNTRLADEHEAELVRGLLRTAATLAAAVDLLERGGRDAVASDKMFDQMLLDYKGCLSDARAILAKFKPEGAEP